MADTGRDAENQTGGAFQNEDELGMAMTQEQIKDVYFAGTSDGIVFLKDHQVRDLDGENNNA